MNRKEHRQSWLADYFGHDRFTVTSASEDASFRSYYRVACDDDSYILMDAPPQHENCEPFINIQQLLISHNINVPIIYSADLSSGFLLLSDFGNTLYLDQLNAETANSLYQPAIQTLINFQAIGNHPQLPPYDRTLLMNEMMLFKDWFVSKHLGLTLTPEQTAVMDNAFTLLADQALQQPRTLVHRDYHSRNLMITTENKPGVIDFQDAVYGPLTYDLASLLKDCYISWPQDTVDHFSEYYLSLYNQQNNSEITFSVFKTWLDLMAAQRHLKAIGIFCRLNYRDGKPGYLNDIPRTMNYLLDTCQRYPVLAPLLTLLRSIQPQLPAR